MQLPLAYLDASAIEEVPVDLWGRIFEAVGWPATLAERREKFGHTDVMLALEQDTPSDELLQALEALHVLGTEAGSEAITAAMEDRRVPRSALPPDAGERELALHLYLAQRQDASMAEVFARAQAQTQEGGDHRAYHEFMGRDDRVVTRLAERADALRELTLAYCRDRGLGDHVQVRAFDDDGAVVFHVIRSHHIRKPLAVIPGRSARATIEYRPVHGDLIRYDGGVGRLRIAARAASVVGFYREALGRILFEDATFFTGDPVCSLRVLQERGRDALDGHGVPGVGRVWMTECLWERGDRNLLHIRSADCFRHIEELHLPLREGELLQAKLKVSVAGKSTRPVTVNIRVPSRIEVSQRRYDSQIERLLTRIGIHNPGTRAARNDLWNLYPWRLSREEWRSAFGRETDALIESRVLVPVRLEAVRSVNEPAAGRALRAHEVADGEYYAVSLMRSISSKSITPTELDGFELDPERLRDELRSRLGITGAAQAWDGRGEVLDLGEIVLGSCRLRLSYAHRAPQNGVGSTLRTRAGGAHPVLLVPSYGWGDNLDVPVAPLESPLPSRKDAIRSALAAAALTHVVPAVFSAPDEAMLVVDSPHGVIWFDGIEILALKPGTHPFLFVELLARNSPGVVSRKSLTAHLSGARDDGDTVVRQAKSKACRLIREALARVGRNLNDDPFPTAGVGAYRCAVPSYVV